MDPYLELNLDTPIPVVNPFDMNYMKREWSEEAYFGENNTFKMEVVSHIKILREIFMKARIDDDRFSDKPLDEKKGIGKEITERIQLLQKTIERHINVEKCYIGLQPFFNAFTISVAWNANSVIKTNKNGTIDKSATLDPKNYQNKDMIKSLEDIAETKNGYKFKSAKDKIIMISLGIDLFTNEKANLTDESIGAILFHEIGHNFQQMISGINEILIDSVIRATLQRGANDMLSPFLIFGLLSIIETSMRVAGYEGAKNNPKSRESLAAAVLKGSILVNKDGTFVGRDQEGQMFVERNLEAVQFNSKMQIIKINVILKLIQGVGYFINGVLKMVFTPLNIALSTIPTYFMLINPKKKMLEGMKKYEQFADMFPMAYGFGAHNSSEFSNALKNMGYAGGAGFTNAKFLNYIPGYNVMVAYNNYMKTHMRQLVGGYDSDRKRIVNDYKVLQYELKNNPDLSKEARAEIEKQMDQIEESYVKFTNSGGSEYFLYNIFLKRFHSDIKKETSSVEENVLDVLNDMKDSPIPGKKNALDKEAKKIDKIPINTLHKMVAGIKESSKTMFKK